MPVAGELVTGGVPEHVRVNREGELCGLSSSGDCFQESCSRGGTATFGDENVSRFHIFAAQLTQGPDFLAAQWMNVIDPALGSSNVQSAAVQLDLIPPQATYF